MKKTILFLILLFVITTLTFAQNRNISRGATLGELYITGLWYGIYDKNWGPPYYDTLRSAIYRLTENGKRLTKQYDADYFANPEITMQPNVILADATPGVVYNKDNYSKNSYPHTALWVSFDYGENWIFREENKGNPSYFPANVDGIIYRGGEGEVYKSIDYGQFFIKENSLKFIGKEPGIEENEVFYVAADYYTGVLTHTYDYFETYTQIYIDSLFIFGQICGIFPDVYRGGLPGEVYISSLFTDGCYKVSFSADTGHTFRHVYVNNDVDCTKDGFPVFMSDRESGVFYIVKSYSIEDKDPWGWHNKICVEYYRDYGETLFATYCHDITKNYDNEVGIKEKEEGIIDDILVYPNPTMGELFVQSSKSKAQGVEIFDIYGRKVLEPPLTVLHSYDLTVLQAGIYFINLTTEKGSITKKIIKY